MDKSHASLLTVFIDEVMKESDTGYGDLAAVAVSRGPGSYTGLRIGVSAAKGICYGAGVPLLAVDTLRLMAAMAIRKLKINTDKARRADCKNCENVSESNLPEGLALKADKPGSILLCPMIDARRMEVYTALYDAGGVRFSETGAHIIDNGWFDTMPKDKKIVFFGNGAEKCRDMGEKRGLVFVNDIYPSALCMPALSDEALREGRIEDTAYFEPFYLKDFLATTPRNRLHGAINQVK